ncbi:MAG: glycosyltransferase family 4 protein [Anaerolineales bacterium]|nr:glycosyltransferase family 4 protein [Anaerolineales bacterium]
MKVAFISFDWPEYCLRLTNALAKDADVCLLAPRPWQRHLQHLDQKIAFRPFRKPRFRQPLRQLMMIRQILGAVRAFGPDVVHLQHGHPWFNLALPLLRRYPLVLTIHDPRFHPGDQESLVMPQRLIDFGFHRANQVIVHTDQTAEIVINELGIDAGIVHVVPHIQLGDEAAQADVAEEENVILFFGRIWEYKGLAYLIKAQPRVSAQVPDAAFVIAGRGEEFAPYRAMMADPARFQVYNEYISDDDRARLFRQASVVVLPYIEASQSGVIPVAYTFGKPVIATTVGGLPEQVEDGRTGLLVPPADETALADAIIRLLQDTALRRQMGANGKQKLDAEWSADAVARKTLPVYKTAIANLAP